MKGTYNGSNNDRIRAAVRACDLPGGATHTWIAEQTGIPSKRVTHALCYLSNIKKLVVAWKHGKWMRYFPTQEALEAAMPALEAFKAEVKARQLMLAREKYARLDPEKIKAKNKRRSEARRQKLALTPKPPKEAKPKADKPKKQRTYKPGPQITYAKPVSVKPQAGGPARMPGDPVITANTRITIAPPPPARLYRTTTYSVLP
jgi:hypothetical protein